MRQQWWDSLGAPQRALGGWQLFPFKTKTTEVQGYGFSDGTTGQGRFFEGLPFKSIQKSGIRYRMYLNTRGVSTPKLQAP